MKILFRKGFFILIFTQIELPFKQQKSNRTQKHQHTGSSLKTIRSQDFQSALYALTAQEKKTYIHETELYLKIFTNGDLIMYSAFKV